MQQDENVGKIALASTLMVSKLVELFLKDILSSSTALLEQKGSRTIYVKHLHEAISKRKDLMFLNGLLKKYITLSKSTKGTLEEDGDDDDEEEEEEEDGDTDDQ